MQHSTSRPKLHCSQLSSVATSGRQATKTRLHASGETLNFIRFFARTYQPAACV